MNIITYLGFTLLSIAIQFVVMDYIQGQLKIDDVKHKQIDLNNTSPKKSFSDILQQYAQKPHALYYQAQNNNIVQKTTRLKPYSNSSIANTSFQTSTDFSSTILDMLYDENTTEDSFTTVTESLYTTTDISFDNITEITFFEKKNNKNKTDVAPKSLSKKAKTEDCSCNLLYKVCDINCCCDSDCSESERKLFPCDENAFQRDYSHTCYSQFSFLVGSNIDDLFCVVKSNLPDKRNIIHTKHDPSALERHFKWHSNRKMKVVQEFRKKTYTYGDPIWLLRNGTIYYVDLPSPMINTYCSDRKPLRFLKEETIKCNVKLPDLEVLQILSTAKQTSVISVTENALNTTTLNCTTLHCTNWTIILCDDITCINYNESLHDPLCTENVCSDLALKVVYTFYYYENKITNATIKLYTQKVALSVPFIEQEVNVRFVIANESTEHLIEYSGNPGYIVGLPLIVSYAKNNYTDHFYNDTSKTKKNLLYPANINGMCARSNMRNNVVLFGTNKRIKCRLLYNQKVPKHNETETCRKIQKSIADLLGIDQKITISPLGNPYGLKDENWIPMMINTSDELVYGELNAQKTKLYCYNLVARHAIVFSYADVSEKPTKKELKILSAIVQLTANNITFNIEDVSTVITVDTIFIDETRPTVYEYAGGPQLNIHLPRDFFFPFASNRACIILYNKYFLMIVSFATLIVK